MPTFNAQLLYSTHAGQAVSIEQSMFSFGRAAENAMVIEMPQASRVHGHLYYEEGQWFCVNESPNGTTINGRKLSKKPQALKHGDVVGVGDVPMFAAVIRATEEAPAPTTEDKPAEERPTSTKLSPEDVAARKRLRLWVGVAIYLVVALVAMIVVSQVAKRGAPDEVKAATQLSREQISQEITEPVKHEPLERMSNEWRDKARNLFERRRQNPRNLYEAYVAYKEALAYSGKPVFEDGLVQREFGTCEEELLKLVTRTYREAYALLRSRQYEAAEQKFRLLVQDIYPDSASRIYQNANEQLAIARKHMGR